MPMVGVGSIRAICVVAIEGVTLFEPGDVGEALVLNQPAGRR